MCRLSLLLFLSFNNNFRTYYLCRIWNWLDYTAQNKERGFDGARNTKAEIEKSLTDGSGSDHHHKLRIVWMTNRPWYHCFEHHGCSVPTRVCSMSDGIPLFGWRRTRGGRLLRKERTIHTVEWVVNNLGTVVSTSGSEEVNTHVETIGIAQFDSFPTIGSSAHTTRYFRTLEILMWLYAWLVFSRTPIWTCNRVGIHWCCSKSTLQCRNSTTWKSCSEYRTR